MAAKKGIKGLEVDDDIAEFTGTDADLSAALKQGLLDDVTSLTLGGKLTELPDALFSLTQLEALCFEKCRVKSLPDGLFKLTKLESLRVNVLSLPTLPEGGWAKLKALTDFSMPSGLTKLPDDFGELPNLEGDLGLRGTKLKALPESVGRLAKVTEVTCNRALTRLPKSMGGMKSLTRLSLGLVKELPEDLGELKQLREVWVHEGAALSKLPASIGGCTALEHLELRDVALTELPESLADCPLKNLSLTKLERLTRLPARLGANGALQVLTLGTGVTVLPESLLASKSLRRVVLPVAHEAALRASSAKVLSALGDVVQFQ